MRLLILVTTILELSNAILKFATKPAFTLDSFIQSPDITHTIFLCCPQLQENDLERKSSTSIRVEYILPDDRVLTEETNSDLKYYVITNYVPTTKCTLAQLIIADPTVEDTGSYTCVASTSPTVRNSSTVKLEIMGQVTCS
jgi:hypothetical protein